MSEQIEVGGRYQFRMYERRYDSIVVEIDNGGAPLVVIGGHWDEGIKSGCRWGADDADSRANFLENHTFREMAFEPAAKPPEHPDSAQLLEARGHEFAVLAGQDRELIKVLLRRLLRELEGGA